MIHRPLTVMVGLARIHVQNAIEIMQLIFNHARVRNWKLFVLSLFSAETLTLYSTHKNIR